MELRAMSLEKNRKSEIATTTPRKARRWPFLLLGFVVGIFVPNPFHFLRTPDHQVTVFEFLDRAAHAPSVARSIDGTDVSLRFEGERLIEWARHETRKPEIVVRAVYSGLGSTPIEVSEIVRLDPKDFECRIRIRATAERVAISQCLRRNHNVS
jgi:hypothetical protein